MITKNSETINKSPLSGPNRFKLGIFSANADGGLALTRVPERWPARWDEIVSVARMADNAGFEFFLPISRWKGFGGKLNARELSYETFTFAAALSGVTERIALFSTVHAPLVHPVFAAKALATVDHASGGRAGLNVVCGWSPEEFALFGQNMVEDRYAHGSEWIEIVERIVSSGETFDYDGKYFQLKGVSGLPLSVQKPRPPVLNAAFSPPGRNFAAKYADHLFTTFIDIPSGRTQIEDMRKRSAFTGRDVGVFTTCHVVCRESKSEAEDYYEYYAVTMEDKEACDKHMLSKQQNAGSHDEQAFRLHRKRFAGGAGSYPLIGTPESIADEITLMAEVGFSGATISFVNYLAELPYFIETVLPELKRRGLRL